jgi:hypothetical protein
MKVWLKCKVTDLQAQSPEFKKIILNYRDTTNQTEKIVESGIKHMRTEHKQGEKWLTCFSEIGIALEAEQLFLLNCLCSEKQVNRFLLL